MTRRGNLAAGIFRAATFRPDAITCFGTSVTSFLNSLAPLIAFPIAAALIELVNDSPVTALAMVLLSLVVQLAPPVLSHALAVFWGREGPWLRYATAFNWCHWALPVVGAALSVLIAPTAALGLVPLQQAQIVLGVLGIYSLCLHASLARWGLGLPRWKAILLTIVVDGLTLGLAIGPSLLVP